MKLIEARKNKGYSQEYVASKLCLDESNYCRRKKGQVKINFEEWKQLSELLGVSIEDIYEPDDNQVYIYNENSTSTYQGNNNTIYYPVPEFMIEALQKLIKKLEEENSYLRNLLKQTKK
jgi:transcriptional regulator with XRE-family HTH domain